MLSWWGSRVLNCYQPASWLILVHPLSFLHHHHHPCCPNSHPTTCNDLEMSPSPHVRDVGSMTNAPRHIEWTAVAAAPPLFREMWVAYSPSMEKLEQ